MNNLVLNSTEVNIGFLDMKSSNRFLKSVQLLSAENYLMTVIDTFDIWVYLLRITIKFYFYLLTYDLQEISDSFSCLDDENLLDVVTAVILAAINVIILLFLLTSTQSY